MTLYLHLVASEPNIVSRLVKVSAFKLTRVRFAHGRVAFRQESQTFNVA